MARILVLVTLLVVLGMVAGPAAAEVHASTPDVGAGVADACHGNGPVDNVICFIFRVLPERGRSGGRAPWSP